MRKLGLIAAAVALATACGGDDGVIEYDAAPPPDAGAPDVEQVPIDWPDSPDDYVGAITGYTYELSFPEIIDGVAVCCRDFGSISKDNIEDGTDNIDNALARLTVALGDTYDFQQQLNDAVESGDLVLLVDHRELDGDPDDFVLTVPFGAFAMGTNYNKASAGNGEFNVLRESFVEGTGRPENVFNPSSLTGGETLAGPSSMTMMLPMSTTMLPLPVSAAEITGSLQLDADGATYVKAEISGYFLLSDMWDTMNEILQRPECACLGLTGPVYVEIAPSLWGGDCLDDAEIRCTDAEEEVCVTFADTDLADGICGVGPAIFGAMADIDLDGDPDMYEALSVGFIWSAVPAKIVGVEPAP